MSDCGPASRASWRYINVLFSGLIIEGDILAEVAVRALSIPACGAAALTTSCFRRPQEQGKEKAQQVLADNTPRWITDVKLTRLTMGDKVTTPCETLPGRKYSHKGCMRSEEDLHAVLRIRTIFYATFTHCCVAAGAGNFAPQAHRAWLCGRAAAPGGDIHEGVQDLKTRRTRGRSSSTAISCGAVRILYPCYERLS